MKGIQMITLEANYSKKIGLPNYSSHQFSVSLKSELSDISQVEQESARLYDVLQQSVDNNIQQVGYLPGESGNGRANGNGNGGNGGGRSVQPKEEAWKCSPKQKDLILKIIEENKLPKMDVEKLARERFSKGVIDLNKLEASGLIEELIEKYPSNNRKNTPTR